MIAEVHAAGLDYLAKPVKPAVAGAAESAFAACNVWERVCLRWSTVSTRLFRGSWGCVQIHCCGHGGYWFRPYGGSLLEKSPECRPSQK
jgi:hypothetical protein